MYYFGGFYLSEEKCVEDILKAYYVKGAEEIISLESGDVIHHLYSNGADENCIVSTKKYSFLYQKSLFISDVIDCNEKEGFELLNCSDSQFGTTVFVYRYNKDIHLIHVELGNGMSIVLGEWKDDFAGFSLEHEREGGSYVSANFRAYDKDGNIIDEMSY